MIKQIIETLKTELFTCEDLAKYYLQLSTESETKKAQLYKEISDDYTKRKKLFQDEVTYLTSLEMLLDLLNGVEK